MHRCCSCVNHKRLLSLSRCPASLNPHSSLQINRNSRQVLVEVIQSAVLRYNDGQENRDMCAMLLPCENCWCRGRLGLGGEEL